METAKLSELQTTYFLYSPTDYIILFSSERQSKFCRRNTTHFYHCMGKIKTEIIKFAAILVYYARFAQGLFFL